MRLHLKSSNPHLILSCAVAMLVIGSILTFLVATQPKTEALSTSDFIPGRIIDDSVFYNKDAMNVAQIQDFLNKLIPNCDTRGTGLSEYGGGTRAQYASSKGWPGPPYVCLNNYYENPQNNETSYEKGGGVFDGGVSAAQIIYTASQQYGINPQVLLVMLKKESQGPLTSDSWPLKSQYLYAMGYGCPDSGPGNSANCDAAQGGFYKQIMKAAWQLKYYKDHQNDYRYKIGVNQIQYSPDVACGTKTVNIENIATLSLYIYTPYTPNDAALANYPGSASCGAYGNRNFFMYFKEWFGSPNYRAPTCNSRVEGVVCVWLLFDPNQRTEFLTIDNQERDMAVMNNKYSYDSVAFYAFSSRQPGTIPVYRVKLPNEYFYTSSESEKSSLAQSSQNTVEGIAFYVYPSAASNNISYPVYRLNGSRGHLLTTSAGDRDTYVATGYTYEGISFNTPSGYARTSAPAQNKESVYRLNNGQQYLYTSSLRERDDLLHGGWIDEGILTEAPASPTSTPVYRLYKDEHLYTASVSERDALVRAGWKYEGVAWYVDSSTPPTYRFYKSNGKHFYTSDLNEATSISNNGATYEGVAFGTDQTANSSIYRMYNNRTHFFTGSIDEVMSIVNKGWRYEGVALSASKTTTPTPVYRLNGPYHFYTASQIERDSLVRAGWKYEGVAWYVDSTPTPVYRLNGPYHFYTASQIERDSLVRAGWKYEGVAW